MGLFTFLFAVAAVAAVNLNSKVLAQTDPEQQQTIDSLAVEEFIVKSKMPAASLAIVKDGQVWYTNGYGDRDFEKSIPANENTLFAIGSITKGMVATLAVKTLSEMYPDLGEQVLDTPVQTLMPNYNFTLSDRYRSEETTFRDLLSHRVGLVSQEFNLLFGAIPSTDDLLYRQRYAPEMHPFRTNADYNNGHYALVGQLIEEMTGVPIEQLLEEFFAELGMLSTTYVKESDDHDNLPNRAVGYYWKDGEQNHYDSELLKIICPMTAAGGVLSDAIDMAKYLEFHANRGLVDANQVVPETVMDWLYKNSNPNFAYEAGWKKVPGERESLSIGYGLGFSIGSYDGWQVLNHDGYLPPFYSLLTFLPGLKLGIYTSSSSTGDLLEYFGGHTNVHASIIEIHTGGPAKAFTSVSCNNNYEMFPSVRNLKQMENPVVPNSYHSVLENDNVLQTGDILGEFGNQWSGELNISQKPNLTGQLQPYLEYGTLATGFLEKIFTNKYKLQVDSNLTHLYYSAGLYDGPNIIITQENFNWIKLEDLGLALMFERDQSLEDLPPIPWDSDSCGPELTA